MTNNFWKNKRVIVTGATGFKGSWLCLLLKSYGADITGVSLAPPTEPSLFNEAAIHQDIHNICADIRDLANLKGIFDEVQPSIVFHLAAQSLVRYSYDNPVETYEVNVMGTLNVLEATRSVGSVKAAIIVTTDKCYENKEWVWGYRENDPMGGYDPYSSSKGAAELLVSSYRNSYFPTSEYHRHGVSLSSVRAGNVIGGGDWAADRLLPDIIESIERNMPPNIRSPNATRPWQHVLEPLTGYMLLAENMIRDGASFSEAWNFGPDQNDVKSVKSVVEKLLDLWGLNFDWSDDSGDHPHEAHLLRLDCSKARSKLGWSPVWNLETSLRKIYEWSTAKKNGLNPREISLRQISEYTVDLFEVTCDE